MVESKREKARALVNARKAIADAVEGGTLLDLNLAEVEFPAGATYRFGDDVFVTMVCGFGVLPEDWDVKGSSEKNNAVSIVVRLQYKGKSVLFCGDAVGRHIDAPPNAEPIATERYMLEQKSIIPIDSDVLIAPHHGADNGSSTKFIDAVSPRHVIFSAGHQHKHPRAIAVKRYTDAGVKVKNMLRTDWEDDEGAKEWSVGRTDGHVDKAGDDDIDIVIRASGKVEVDYSNPSHAAPDPD